MAIADTARLIASLELQDKFSRPAGQITGSLTRMESGFSQIGRGAGQVGSGLARLGTVATVAAVGGLTAVIKTSADMEEAFVGIQKTVDETVDFSFVRLREALRDMSVETGTAFEELSRIGQIGGALGIPIQDLEGFIDVVNRLGVSTDLSVDEAATALGTFRTILNLSGDEVRTFADDLVALGNAGNSTEPQIVQLAERFAAAGNRAGLSSGEILALSSALAGMGINVEAGGTALSQTFNEIATAIGTGSDDIEGFTDVLNISASEFRTAWETDALGTFQDFLQELSKLDPIAQATALSMAGITGQRQLSAIGLMSQNWDEVGRQLEVTRTNQEDLATESDKFFGTTAGGFRRVKESIRLTADTIGQELLPLVNELSDEFVTFLNLDSTQGNIREFAEDLAGGIRNVVDELKGADFSGLIQGMQLAGEVASRAFGIFRSLPPELQALAVSAIALNKISGGAVGSIAKGLGNIIGGTIKLAFPKLDIFSRGATPANPIFTKEVGLGGAVGGVGGGVAGLGAKGFWAGVGKVFGIAAAATIGLELGKEIGNAIIGPQVQPQIDLETDIFEQQLEAFKESPERLAHMEVALEDAIRGIAGNTVDPLERFLIPGLSALESQLSEVRELRAAAIAQQDAALENNRTETDLLNEAKQQRLAQAAQTRSIKELTLEQRLIRDKKFKAEIDADQFIRILRRTSEFGEKGRGTAIEFGPKTGRDPLGDAFIALVKRLPKNQLTGEVYREVSNHIVALEEVQRDLIREGKIAAARHAQQNIDKLAALIGKVDNTRPLLERNAEKSGQTAANTAMYLTKAERAIGIASEQTGLQRTIAGKDFSPKVNVSLTTNTTVSVNDVIRSVQNYNYAIGSGPGGTPDARLLPA